jgi:hypothetical protein
MSDRGEGVLALAAVVVGFYALMAAAAFGTVARDTFAAVLPW